MALQWSRNLNRIASLFLKLGYTSFAGPAAHIAMMEDEVIPRKKWMSREPCRVSGGKHALLNKKFVIIARMLQALWGLGISEVSKSKHDKKLLAEIRVAILFG